jgi:hypothetical protein
VAAFAVEIPFFFLGTPSGHDVEFHLYSWLEVLAQWKQGVWFPRWATLANFGYGEPRFLFYPPASWVIGSVISKVFPWTIASCVFIWIALSLAGLSMFVLARRWFDRRDAIFVAVLYAVNPYHLVIVYWRSAFAELLAASLVPLLLLCVLNATKKGRRAIVPLSIVLAAAWLVNAPAAVMIHYSLALLMVFFAWREKSTRIVLVAGAAMLLGGALASFYLVPAIYEQRWVQIGNAVSAGSRPSDNFLFVHTTDADHDAFNRLISWVAVAEMAAIAGLLWAARAWKAARTALSAPHGSLWSALVGWAAACSVMMMPGTAMLWRILPKLQFMQFPWRWLLCLSMMFSLLVTVALRRWWMRFTVCAVGLLVIVVGWHRIQAPWWDNAADLREMQDNMVTGAGYEGTDEYLPLRADKENIDKDARKITVDGPAHAALVVSRWDAKLKRFTAEMAAADHVAVKLFPYPAWRVEVNGRLVETGAREGSGQMLVPVGPEMNRVEIRFVRTWDRTMGGWISVVALVTVLTSSIVSRKRQKQLPSSQSLSS